MNEERIPFELAEATSKRKLKRRRVLARWTSILSLGAFRLADYVKEADEEHQAAAEDLSEYDDLTQEKGHLESELQLSTSVGTARLSEHGAQATSVVGRGEYGPHWDSIRRRILARDNYKCTESDGRCRGALDVHHVVPISRGGTNVDHNLVTLCRYHHSRKHPGMKG